jgi:hypothetical protein
MPSPKKLAAARTRRSDGNLEESTEALRDTGAGGSSHLEVAGWQGQADADEADSLHNPEFLGQSPRRAQGPRQGRTDISHAGSSIMLAEIMNAPGFGEVMFLVAFILFLIELVLRIMRPANWVYESVLMVAGFAAVALGWLALATGN